MKQLKSKTKKFQNGITLIALVITIIVLLILAGVSIATLTGENGILTRANDSNTQTEIATEKEEIELAIINSYINDEYTLNTEVLLEELKKNDKDAILLNLVNLFEIEYKDKKYLINLDGNLIETVNQSSENMWKYTEEIKIVDGQEVIQRKITDYIGPKVEKIVIPNYLDDIHVYSIDSYCFEENGMQNILKTLTISNGIQVIGGSAFKDCQNLEGELVIPDSVTLIQGGAFNNCTKINSLKLGKDLEEIGTSAFLACEGLIGELIIPDKVKIIGQSAFQGTNFRKVELGKNVEIVKENAFNSCKLISELILTDKIKELGVRAFYGCENLTGVLYIPNSVKIIGMGCFYRTNITKLLIDNSIDAISIDNNGIGVSNIEYLR